MNLPKSFEAGSHWRLIHGVMWLLGLSLGSPSLFASPAHLELRQGETTTLLAIDSLRKRAEEEFLLFDPYRGEKIEIRGLLFRDLIHEHFDPLPRRLIISAWDDYEATLSDWDDANWILVTHENGEALGLRQRGPVRLVERDDGGRDRDNLRNFNEWLWMIRRIEAEP